VQKFLSCPVEKHSVILRIIVAKYLSKLSSCLTGLVVFSGCFFGKSQAQIFAPKYSNEFLQIGVGARAAAMGGAQSAVVSDVTAAYWNPAGLLHGPELPEFALMHSEYFAGIAKYDYAGLALPVKAGGRFAASFIRLGIDNIPNTLNLIDASGNINYNNIEEFSDASSALLLSYSREAWFLKGLSLGGSTKIINRRIGNFANAWGFGFDLGAQYTHKRFRLGLMASDITSTFNAWSFNTSAFGAAFVQTGNTIPTNSIELTLPSFRAGAGYQFFPDKKIGILLCVDNGIYTDKQRNVLINAGRISIDPYAGAEFNYRKKIFLRGGYKNLQRTINQDNKRVFTVFPTAGLGLSLKNLQIDYALTNIGNFSRVLYSHVFSIRVVFDPAGLKKTIQGGGK
jgi:hypothetical protein